MSIFGLGGNNDYDGTGIAAGVAARVARDNVTSEYQGIIAEKDRAIADWQRHTKRLKLRLEKERSFRMGWQRRALGLEGVALEKGEDVNELRAASDRYIALHEKELNQKIDAKSDEIEAKVFEELPLDKNGGY